ncbi:hypothetical protein [Glutamicibacter sp. BW77]|uniref:hypothetical protein n=1 Tax=Glutamicibacter sp. BW77 TaxID=2024402 RepID=UPI00114433DA|nr:hypothetical protein [Glutamicibacter sp. BW77]
MAETEERSAKRISRRVVLTLGALTAGAVVYGQLQKSPPDPSVSPSPPEKPIQTPKPTPVLKNRDPSVIAPLKRTRNTSGALRRYEGAFPATKIRRVELLPGLQATGLPWLAVSIVGPIHQLQIINPSRNTPAHIVEIPKSHSGGVQSMIWDKKTKYLYLATLNYLLVWKPSSPSEITIVGKVPGATTIYDLQLDSQGTVWGGTYPLGAAFKYAPKTKKIDVFKRVATDTDYVRRVAIDSNDDVWLGTGSRNPRVFRFSSKSPQKITEIPLPEPKRAGFVSSLEAVGNSIVVSIDNVSGQLLLNPQTNSWVGSMDRVWSGRKLSAVNPATKQFYNVSDGQLFATSSSTWQDQLVGKLSASAPLAIYATSSQVVVVSSNKTGLQIEVFRLSSKSVQLVSTVALARGQFVVQSLMSHSDGNIYVGGYMGHGITAVHPDTGKHWTSPSEQNAINQIEGMIEFNAQKTYVGSYGSADIVRLNSNAKNNPEGYQRLLRLATDYEQSRIFAWAKNSKQVFFGTVPEYGRSGGVLGAIDPRTDEVSWVLDGDGEGFIRHHSITGLVADEKYIYGTTSVRNGYGLADTDGNAKVFKLDIATKKISWSVAPIAQCGALYSPKLLAGWLLVADLEGVSVLDPVSGKLLKKHRLTNSRNTSYRPGWKNADLVVVENRGKAVHTAAGTTTAIDFDSGTLATIGSPQLKSQFGTRLTVTNSGRVFANVEKTAIAELDLQPIASQPKKPSAKKASPQATATT